MSNCEFCSEFGDLPDQVNLFSRIFGGQTSRILMRTRNFVVFPGIGAFAPGYLLIIPINHYTSLAQLPDILRAEFEDLKLRVRNTLTSHYSEPIFYEHGPINDDSKNICCIYHAHLHCLPFRENLIDELKNTLDGKRVESIFEAVTWIKNRESYIYFETNLEEKFIFTCTENLPSQYVRRLIAKKLGKPDEWDWLLWVNRESVMQTLRDLSGKNYEYPIL